MKHFINVAVLTAIVTAGLIFLLENINLLPVAASAESNSIDRLFGLHIQVIAFLFALIMVFMLYSVVVFRRKPGETGDGKYFHSNTGLEIVWTVVPLITVLYFSYLGGVSLKEITTPASDELVVEVIGSQWAWRFDYPDAGVTSTVMNLPVDRTILLKLTSPDVIHSFWVPEFRVKQDAVPGLVREMRITPTQLGAFKVRCAELCGLDHTSMLADVNVMSKAEFNRWIEGEQSILANLENLTPAQRGERVAQENACIGCHSIDGSQKAGPTWLNVFGSEEALVGGGSVTVDEEYLRESIIDPAAQVVDGYANIMPNVYADTLSDADVNNLIEYIKSLSE